MECIAAIIPYSERAFERDTDKNQLIRNSTGMPYGLDTQEREICELMCNYPAYEKMRVVVVVDVERLRWALTTSDAFGGIQLYVFVCAPNGATSSIKLITLKHPKTH